jgi:hypothetical protein
VDYVVLRAPLDQTLRRARERPDAEKFSAEGVRHMHAAFAGLGQFDVYAVYTSNPCSAETAAEVGRRRIPSRPRRDQGA